MGLEERGVKKVLFLFQVPSNPNLHFSRFGPFIKLIFGPGNGDFVRFPFFNFQAFLPDWGRSIIFPLGSIHFGKENPSFGLLIGLGLIFSPLFGGFDPPGLKISPRF